MQKLYFSKLLKYIDISPFGRANLYKGIFYIFWGVNAIFFLADSVAYQCHDCSKNSCNSSTSCTTLKKITKADIDIEKYELIRHSIFSIISSYNYLVPTYEIYIIQRDRSPPV